MKKNKRQARPRTQARREARAWGQSMARSIASLNRGEGPIMFTMSLDGDETTVAFLDHPCECSICEFLLKHDIADGSAIPAHLLPEFEQAQRAACTC